MSTEVVRSYERTANPEGRRASAAARHDPRTYAKSIVKKWPVLNDQVRAELRAILSPITALTADQSGGE